MHSLNTRLGWYDCNMNEINVMMFSLCIWFIYLIQFLLQRRLVYPPPVRARVGPLSS